jgi:Putative prokaryotic signal transducing protein
MSGRLVTVVVAGNAMEAGLYRATLEHADIPVVVADENIVSMDWFLSNVVGGIKIQVPEDRFGEATDVLTQTATPVSPGDAAALSSPPLLCGACGSLAIGTYTGTQVRNIVATLASFVLLPVPIPVRETRLQCGACGRVVTRP